MLSQNSSKLKTTKFNSYCFYIPCSPMQYRNVGLESRTISTLQPVELEFIYTILSMYMMYCTSNTFVDSFVVLYKWNMCLIYPFNICQDFVQVDIKTSDTTCMLDVQCKIRNFLPILQKCPRNNLVNDSCDWETSRLY